MSSALSSTGLTVIVPVYNDAQALPETLRRFSAVLRETPHELLVVDDGSTDGGPASVQEHDGVRILRHESNRGYGASLKTGLREAAYPTVAICDADGTYTIEDLPAMVAASGENRQTLVVAARRAFQYRSWGGLKVFLRSGLMVWIFLLTWVRVRDINSGLRVFPRDQVLPLLDQLSDRFSFTTGQTLHWLFQNKPIVYLESEYRYRQGQSKVRFGPDSVRVFGQTVQLGFRYQPLYTAFLIACLGLAAASPIALLF